MKVEVLSTITHKDQLVQPGETVELEKELAARLIDQGIVKEVKTPAKKETS